jgi:N-acetylglucosamine kinase-like BadF-type ATPase
MERARDEAGRPPGPAARAVLSVAGSFDAQLQCRFTEWAHSIGLAQDVFVVPDVLPVLAAGTPSCIGVALICGTGSSAFARAADGRTSLCGGWGYLLGDEGSGYAIGRAALRTALDHAERRISPQPLTTTILQFLQARTAKEAAAGVYRAEDSRSAVAAIAHLVVRAADDGDGLAEKLIDEAAGELAGLTSRAARAAGLGANVFALAATGGVLVSSKRMQGRLQERLLKMSLECTMGIVEEPLEGCIRLAEMGAQASEILSFPAMDT